MMERLHAANARGFLANLPCSGSKFLAFDLFANKLCLPVTIAAQKSLPEPWEAF
jgi:hypothetical protein